LPPGSVRELSPVAHVDYNSDAAMKELRMIDLEEQIVAFKEAAA
jgi:hypothetical protein